MGVWAYFLDPGTEDDEQWMAAFVEQWTGPYIVFWLTAFVSILSLMVKRLWDLAINAWVLPMGMLAGPGSLYTSDIIRIVFDFIVRGAVVFLGVRKGQEVKPGPSP